jgi:spore germination protein GerM
MKKTFWVGLAACALALPGCGVPLEGAPHPVLLPSVSTAPSPDLTASGSGAVTEVLYLIQDGQLTAVSRNLPHAPAASQQLRDLLAGPAPAEQQLGLASALAGTELGLSVTIDDGQATVELATGLEGTGRTDDILAFAQIVCTLTSRSDVKTVTFTRAGQHVEVPRADSSLTRDPLTAADYASLISA